MPSVRFFIFLGEIAIVINFAIKDVQAQKNAGDILENTTCHTGFKKNNFGKCVDVNECNRRRSECTGYRVKCQNLMGSYRCECPPRMHGNGIDACGFVMPFHQVVEYVDFSPITSSMVVENPAPTFIRKRQNQLKIFVNRYASQDISKIIIKTVTPLEKKTEKFNITFDVYFKRRNYTPKHYIDFLTKTRNKAGTDLAWMFGESSPEPESSMCTPAVVRFGRERFHFGTTKAPSLGSSLEICPGTNNPMASMSCRVWKHIGDGTKTAYYAYRSITTHNCTKLQTTTSIQYTAPVTENTTVVTMQSTASTVYEATTAMNSTEQKFITRQPVRNQVTENMTSVAMQPPAMNSTEGKLTTSQPVGNSVTENMTVVAMRPLATIAYDSATAVNSTEEKFTTSQIATTRSWSRGSYINSSATVFNRELQQTRIVDKVTTNTNAITLSASSTSTKDISENTITLSRPGQASLSKQYGMHIEEILRRFAKSLSDSSFRITKEAFVKGNQIMNMISHLVEESNTFELSTSSVAVSVQIVDLLIENPAHVEVTDEEKLKLALSFEKLSTRVKLENEEVFTAEAKSLFLQVLKVGAGKLYYFGSGDGSAMDKENQGRQSNFSDVKAYFPDEAIRRASDVSPVDEPKASFILYKNTSLFSVPSPELGEIEVPQVLSASVAGIGITNLSENFWFQMTIKTNQSKLQRNRNYFRCAFLDEETKTWSTEGCYFVPNSNPPNCSCDHLTNFALIVKNVHLPDEFALDIVGKVGCSISIIGLIWMLGCYLSSTSLLKVKTNQLHAHLGICLLTVYIVFLAGVERTESKNGCIAIAALLHFFLLASWGWMTVECITMYRKMVSVLGYTGSGYVLKSAAAVYGGAVAIVAVTMGVTIGWYDKKYFIDWHPDPQSEDRFTTFYISERLCWLRSYPLTFGFLVPIGLAFSLNLLAFIRISKAITCDRKKIRSSRKTTPVSELKDYLVRAVIITFLFGLTWIFAIPLSVTDDNTVNLIFSWLFSIFNSLQGFFIFFFFCVRRKDVRGLWMNKFNRLTRRYPNKSSIRQKSAVTLETMNSTDSMKKSNGTNTSNNL